MEGSSGGGKPDMTDKPSTSVTSVSGGQPGVSGGQPGVSGGQPGVSGGQPGVSGGQPGVSGRQPGVSGGQPGVSGRQPGVSGRQPSVSGGQPGVSGRQPGVSGGQPGVSGGQPGVSGGQPGVSGRQPGVSGRQPSVSGGQPGVSGRQPGVSGGQPGVSDGQPGVSGGQPGVSGGQPGVSGGQPGVSGGQPGVSGRQPGLSGGQPGVCGGQPGVTDQHPFVQKENKKPVPLPRSPGPSNIEAGANTDGAAAEGKPTKPGGRGLPKIPVVSPVDSPDDQPVAPRRRQQDMKDQNTKPSDGERAQQTETEHQGDGDNGQGNEEAKSFLGFDLVDKKDCEKSQTKKVEDFVNSGDYENFDKKELTFMQSGDYENVAQKKLAFMQSGDYENVDKKELSLMQSGVHFKNNLNTVDDEDNTSPGGGNGDTSGPLQFPSSKTSDLTESSNFKTSRQQQIPTGNAQFSSDQCTGNAQSSGDQCTRSSQFSDGALTRNAQPSGDAPKGSSQSSGVAPTGPSQSSGDAPTGPSQSSGDTLTRPSQPSGDTPTGPSQSSGDTPTGPSQSSGDTPTGPSQSSGDTPTGPEQSSGDTPTGPEQSSGDTPTGPEQPSGDTPTGPSQSSGDTPTGSSQPSGDTPTGPGQSSGDTPTGPSQSSGHTPTGTSQSSGGTPTSNAQPSVGAPKESSQSSDGTPTRNSQPSGDANTENSKPSGGTPTRNTQSSGDAPKASSQSSGDTPKESSQSSGDAPIRPSQPSGDTPKECSQSSGDAPTRPSQPSGDTPKESSQSSGDAPTRPSQPSGDTPKESSQSSGDANTENSKSSGDAPTRNTQASGDTHTGNAKSPIPTTTVQPQYSSPKSSGSAKCFLSSTTDTILATDTTSNNTAQSNALGSASSTSASSNYDEAPVSKSHDTSNDSDLEVLGNDKEEETSEKTTNEDLASIPPPNQAMAESVRLPPKEPTKEEAKKHNEKDKGNVAAEISSKDSVAEKNRPFQLKPVRDGKFYLIKSDACSKPFKYTPKYGEVLIDEDEDDLLYDGDHCFNILIKDGTIVLDEIVEAETTNSTPTKPPESGGKVVEESGASANVVNPPGNGQISDDVSTVTDKFQKLNLQEDDKTPKNGQSASENRVHCLLEYFFYHIMESLKFKERFQQECPSVKLQLLEEKKIKVILQSESEEELDKAKEWIYKYQDNFAFTDFSYKGLQGLNWFEKSGDIIRQFLKEHLEGKDVHHEINETAHMISIWSESLRQSDLDKATKEVRDSVRNNKVIKTVSIPMSGQDLEEYVKQSKLLTSDEQQCVKINYVGDKAKISGFAYIVDRIKEQTTKSGGGQSNPATKAPSSSSQYTNPKQLKAGSANTKEPEAQNIEDRGASEQGAGKELSWNAEQLQEFEGHKVLINVTKIPKDKTWKDLQSEFMCQQPCGPRLVYLNGSGKALLIFKSLNDMAKFKDKPQEYEFCRSMKRCLGNLTIRVNPDMWKKLRADTIGKLKKIEVTVTKDKGYLKASTTFQLQVAKAILNEVITSMTKECTIDDVPALAWKTVSVLHKQIIKDIENQCEKPITFSEGNSQICLPEMVEGMEESFRRLKQAIDEMKLKEIQDVPLTEDEVKKAENACGQMVQGGCIFDKTSNTVFIFSDSFDELTKHKFQFDIRIGRKKATARGNRSKAQVVDLDQKSSDIKANEASSENNTASKLSSHSSSLDKKSFTTNEGIKVFVYKGSIVSLDVDCIVNAANSGLSNGGGVARAISVAAGDKFESECKQYIGAHRKLPVGKVCSTSAGKLNYKRVIHTVGPAWYDYSKTSQGLKKCEDDLMNAVLNSFYEAETERMKSIALPAISSAIFGVPIKVCVKQYVRAVHEYSKRCKGKSVLSEIHFVDINENTVRAIQGAFEEPPLSSSRVGPNAATYSDEYADSADLSEPLMFESDSWECGYEFYFMGNTDLNVLLLLKIDIEQIENTSAVLVPVDQNGGVGMIGKKIEAKVGYQRFTEKKNALFKSKQTVGRVLKNPGYGCGFKFVLYAVYPYGEKNKSELEREKSLANTIANVLNTADHDHGIESVAVPMFGIDSKKVSDIKMFSTIFVDTYRQFCKNKFKKQPHNPLKVIVVCHELKVYDVARRVFEEYVQQLKTSDSDVAKASDMQQSIKKGDVSEEGKSLETCVICQDTVADPKTIKCGHTFCTECIDQQFQYQKKCPTCGKICGVITGDQPEGTMNDGVYDYKRLPGYEDCGTIYVMYNFHGGKQQECHPSPGKWYKGIQRTAYLPNNEEGRKILKMLKVAFHRKVTFTIGNSRTTGQEGVITWNDIHHKTDHRPNTQFGYPDPTYLARVKDELEAKGVTEDDI